jgi:hypothetical protein
VLANWDVPTLVLETLPNFGEFGSLTLLRTGVERRDFSAFWAPLLKILLKKR